MAYYPIFLELSGLPCLVIGGGQVAFHKTKALLACGARVTVVSPSLLSSALSHVERQGAIQWRRRPFRAGDLKGMLLVVAATNEKSVNLLAAKEAKRKGIFINVVDQPALCSFIVPSVVRRGRLVLAISTGGVSPALAKWIRKDLEKRYGRETARLVSGMARARRGILKRVRGVARRKALFEKALKAYFRVLKEGE